jgi:hypothetical protein
MEVRAFVIVSGVVPLKIFSVQLSCLEHHVTRDAIFGACELEAVQPPFSRRLDREAAATAALPNVS